MRFRCLGTLIAILCAVALLFFAVGAFAQSYTTGDITGTVTDPSGAVLPNVEITLKSVEKGFSQTTHTNASGGYRFQFLNPGTYSVSAAASGFKTLTVTQTVALGATAVTNLQMEVGTTSTTVEVTGAAPLLQTDSSEIQTTLNTLAVQSLPNPGNDLSFIAQVAPGSTMNTQSGYGNFSSFGISATSNLFTLNGMYDNDPFLNLNNSGATNLLLGNNEIQEATVVSNGYSGQYGGFAGAQVNYVTKSGSNQWHGNAAYWWNGRTMNANDWFNNNTVPVTPRAFDNANEYAASFGGPIKKDKAFFFFNYEGLRVVIPTSQTVYVPSPAFQTAALANLAATGQNASVPFYTTMFNLYNGAPGLSRATPTTSNNNGCGTSMSLPGGVPCTENFISSVTNLTHEYLLAGRFDFNLTNNDKFFIRAQEDKGLQATFTDPINKLFNTQSTQPEYQMQASWNHTFGTKAVNSFVGSATYYSAIFLNANQAQTLAAFPTTLALGDGTLLNTAPGNVFGGTLGGIDAEFPQGRNVTQYQIVDDYSYTLSSKHTLKLGLNFHRYDIGDHDFGFYYSGLLEPLTLRDFFDGGVPYAGAPANYVSDFFLQAFPKSLAVPVSIYGLGWYVQDEWRVTPSLKLTLDLRMDHPSNPVCQTDCFARLTTSFSDLDHNAAIPYNQAIVTGQHQALTSFTTVAWQPRFGFAWTPFGLKNTVLRGGVGMFSDTFPGTIADSLATNPPYDPSYFLANLPIRAPGVAGGPFATAAASNAAFQSGFVSGGTLASIAATTPGFSPPGVNMASNIKVPMYEEWNLELQQSIGRATSFSLNYVGNHGYHETVQFNDVNAFNGIGTFVSLPAAAPDPRFATVDQFLTNGISNYNGLTVEVQHQFQHGLQLQGNFTWSHALDEISNGGILGFNQGTAGGQFQIYPFIDSNLRANYGNSDYDTRKYASISYVYQVPYAWGPKPLLNGWQLSGTLFTRTGLPYSIIDHNVALGLSSFGFGSEVLANYNGASLPTCGVGAASATGTATSPCLNIADFTSAATGYGAQRRNQFYGPAYFDTDFTVMKYTNIPHWEQGKLGLGVQFFNLFNHPNFDQPHNDISNTGLFGQITHALSTPTSILGSFLGGDASPRLIQLTAKLNF
jgi:hypothetical protein